MSVRWLTLKCSRATLAALLLVGLTQLEAHSAELPSFAQVRAAHQVSEAWLYDRNGEVLDTLHLDPNAYRLPWIPLRALSPAMRHALLVSEDKRFYQHGGVDWRAFVGAAWENLVYDTHRGASTLTMQLAGLLDPALAWSPGGRSYTQKWDQIKAARDLEKTWSKAEILEAYLNKVNFRGQLSGINAAAEGLFNTTPLTLNKAEASILSALLRGPNARPAVVAERACGVAHQLSAPRPSCASVRKLADTRLAQRAQLNWPIQLAPDIARQYLLAPGERIQVSLDAKLQRLAQTTLNSALDSLKSPLPVAGEALILNNQTGEILASVSRSATPGTTSLTSVPHAPGAMLQPFLYGLALEQGELSAATVLDDAALGVNSDASQPGWLARDPALTHWASLRYALAQSLKGAAARTVLQVGIDNYTNQLQDFGLESAHTVQPDAPAVTLTQLTNAYRALANGGLLKPTSLRVGGTTNEASRVMPASVAAILTQILADRQAAPDTQPRPRDFAAVKAINLGNLSGSWSIGFSDRYTLGVWIGSLNDQPIVASSDPLPAAVVWQTLFNQLDTPRSRAPRLPGGIVQQSVRFDPPIEPPRRELFLPGTEQSVIGLPPDTAPHIIGLSEGDTLHLNPDLPATWQTVHIYVRTMRSGWVWQLDGAAIPLMPGQADGSWRYTPQPGAHQISLMDDTGKLLDSVSFNVETDPQTLRELR